MSIFNKLYRKKNYKTLSHTLQEGSSLRKTLTLFDLTAFGVAAIIGAGIFTTLGNAAAMGGPAVVFLFCFTGMACGFSAMCYAEFASKISIAGSAYTYAYYCFGEFCAWIIGWNLLLEYAISNIAVALSWSQYFLDFLHQVGIHFPAYLSTNYSSVKKALFFIEQNHLTGDILSGLPSFHKTAYQAFLEAPRFLSLPIIFDLPVLIITSLITGLVYVGIRESRFVSNLLVVIKVALLLLIIGIGSFFIKPANWVPFAPNGISGVLKGVSSIFFAYIGFDAISTAAEECKNPQTDLPRAMMLSLFICTLLYSVIALVLTGVVPYHHLEVIDPLAYIFGPQGINIPWIAFIIQIGAIVALSTVLIVYQMGQPRIWMAMSRDGLLPPIFSSIHTKYHTPWFSTIMTGVAVMVPSLFLGMSEVTELTSIGTLSSFLIVCFGILMMNPKGEKQGKFVIPYINGRKFLPCVWVVILGLLFYLEPTWCIYFFKYSTAGFDSIPPILFMVLSVVLTVFTIKKEYTLIPVLGVLSCAYLLVEIPFVNWIRFASWLGIGIIIYFSYGFHKSKLRQSEN